MIITAKFASVCPCCSSRIEVGSKVEWSKGEKARHVACQAKPVAAPVRAYKSAAVRRFERAWGSDDAGLAEDMGCR